MTMALEMGQICRAYLGRCPWLLGVRRRGIIKMVVIADDPLSSRVLAPTKQIGKALKPRESVRRVLQFVVSLCIFNTAASDMSFERPLALYQYLTSRNGS